MRLFLLLCLLALSCTTHALSIKSDAPAEYVVQPGDSLWEISANYLEHPWEWRQLLQANPHIKNPSRLYPGAVLTLDTYKTNPYLKVQANRTIKLSPYMRPMPIENPIPSIPLAIIEPFLNQSVVLDADTMTKAPFIMSFKNDRLIAGQGDEAYVKNLCPRPPKNGLIPAYAIYRPAGTYCDARTEEILGFKADLVGYATLANTGDPAIIKLTDVVQGVRIRDRVVSNTYPALDLYFAPKAPFKKIDAAIIDLPGDYSLGAMGLVVAIDKGKSCGIEPGDVLAIYKPEKRGRNPMCPECVRIPPERVGELMIFRTFTNTSFGLVMRATKAIEKFDVVTNP